MGLDLIGSTIVWIFLIGGISFFFRRQISRVLRFIPLPRFILFLLIGTLSSIVEENINCPPTGCTLIPFTIPIFFGMLVVHLILIKLLRIRHAYAAMLLFGLMGWIIEFLLGNHKAVLWSAPWVTIVMSFWTIATYSIIVIIPVTLLLKDY